MATAEFCCGAECGITGIGAAPIPDGTRHWKNQVGTVPTSQTTVARNGGRAYRFNPTGVAGEVSYLRRDPVSSTTRWVRGYVRFGALPSTDATLIQLTTALGSSPRLTYRTATQDIIASVGTTVTGATAVPVVTGVWYRVELAADVSTGTSEMSLTVDGVDKGTAQLAQTATTLSEFRVGAQCAGAVGLTADVYWDDIAYGANLVDYPIGAGQIIGLVPNADGTHSTNTAGDFIYGAAGANIATDATDTWSYLDHLQDTITDFLNAANAATGEYLEWSFTDLPAVASILGLEVVSAHHGASTTANLQSLRLRDGATDSDVFADIDFSQTTLCYNSKQYATAPSSGVAWTKTKVDALKARWGSSWTAADVAPDAYIDAIMLEVDYVPSSASTRIYLTHNDAASVAPAVDAGWERSLGTFVRRRSTITKAEASSTTHTALFGSSSTSQTAWAQFISPPLDVNQTINQAFSMVMRCQENSLAENAHLAVVLRVIQPNLTSRGTLFTNMTTSTEFSTAPGETRILSGATTSVAALAGDRLVLDVGVHGVTPANADLITLEYGANSGVADHTLAAGNTNSLSPWYEIAQAITFDPEPHIASGALERTLDASMSGVAVQKFVGSGTPATSLSATMVGDATLKFVGSGTPATSLSGSMSGVAVATFTGSGAMAKTLSASMTGAGTMVDDGVGPPPAAPTLGGGKIIFVDIEEPETPKPKKKKPRPVPVDVGPLAGMSGSPVPVLPAQFNPELWHRMAQFRVRAPVMAAPTPEPPQEPLQDRLMRQLMAQADTPAFGSMDNEDQFLEHFLRMIDMEIK